MKILKQNLATEIVIESWKVTEGQFVAANRVVFVYSTYQNGKQCQKKYKISDSGTVKRFLVPEKASVLFGAPIIELDLCPHATVIKDMCAHCGTDLRDVSDKSTALVPMVHAVPELKVSMDIAKKIGASDAELLLTNRKLVLLVDLDQTLIHTTNDDVNPNLKDVHHFQLYGPKSPWYHTRLRPGTNTFLNNLMKQYELHICTFGARDYAHQIAGILDPSGRLFSDRILSRDECFDSKSKTANLTSLFPCGENLVCIIDDREDVWNFAKNQIHVKPYVFFKHTGDINAPPQLSHSVPTSQKQQPQESTTTPPQRSIENVENLPDKIPAEEEGKVVETILESMPEISETKTSANHKNNDNDNNNNGDKNLENHETLKSVKDQVSVADEIPKKEKSPELVDVEDTDDYLLYLEEILKKVHSEFYEIYEQSEKKRVPELKEVIPRVRSQVLKGCKIVFSGLVPKNINFKDSRPYYIADSLGAVVSDELNDDCTHLVAVKPGTDKVSMARKYPKLKVVTPNWLWICAERWEKVEEDLFPLNVEVKNYSPPSHCSPDRFDGDDVVVSTGGLKRKRDVKFIDTINPLMSFSSADIADMDREVEDIFNDDSESDSSDDEEKEKQNVLSKMSRSSSSSSSSDSYTAESPTGWKKKRKSVNDDDDDDDDDDDGTDPGSDSEVEISHVASDDEDLDDDLSRMGEELERGFLSD